MIFLPTIIGKDMLNTICPHIPKKTTILDNKPDLKFYIFKNDPFIPVEFSVAAYRFGHSMVRPEYRLNAKTGADKPKGEDPRLPIFPDLLAFGEFNDSFAIDWRLFFNFGNNPNQFSKARIQPAYKIDPSLVNPLAKLPPPITGETPPSLAELNLRRGLKLELPSGQAVAKAMGHIPISDDKLLVEKANLDGMGAKGRKISITDISPNFASNAPLWFYILSEAAQHFKTNATPIHLGPVGGRIVGETFVGIMHGDPTSIFGHPTWKPYKDFVSKPGGNFGIVELIKQAMLSENKFVSVNVPIPYEKIDAIISKHLKLFRKKGVLTVRAGYKISGNWITNKPAIVVTVAEKIKDLRGNEKLPAEVESVPVDVRQATAMQRLRSISPEQFSLVQAHGRNEFKEPQWKGEKSVRTGKDLKPPVVSANIASVKPAKKEIDYTPASEPLTKLTTTTTIIAYATPDDGFTVLADFFKTNEK